MDIATVPVALLAGGLATRLRPITEAIPKALVEVAGRPFIDYQLALLHRNGIRRIVLCLGYLGEQIEHYLGNGARYGLELNYSYDGDRLLGTGGALQRALPFLGDVFWVLYGDSYMDINYRGVLTAFASGRSLGLMTVLRNENRWDKSNVVFRNGRLVCYSKRELTDDMQYIDYGVILLRSDSLNILPAAEPFDLADVLSELAARGHLMGHEVTQRFYEIGSPRGLEETQRYLVRQKDNGCRLVGPRPR